MLGFSVTVGGVEHTPDWTVIVEYEHQIRKEAIKGVLHEGKDIFKAMEDARGNEKLRSTYFATAAFLSIMDRSAASSQYVPAFHAPQLAGDSYGGKMRGRSKGNSWRTHGKGQGCGKGGKFVMDNSLPHTTSEGQQICSAWNNPHVPDWSLSLPFSPQLVVQLRF